MTTLRAHIGTIEDDRISLRAMTNRRGEPVERDQAQGLTLAVTPDEDEDDCLAEARDYVESLYGDRSDVTSISECGWEGGYDGPRERVLVEVRIHLA